MIDWKAISAELETMPTGARRVSTPGGSDKAAAAHIQHIAWHGRTSERHDLLSPRAQRAIEDQVIAELAELDVPTVWFHTVFMGPLVILCSLSSDTADICSIETDSEYRAADNDDEPEQRRRWTRY